MPDETTTTPPRTVEQMVEDARAAQERCRTILLDIEMGHLDAVLPPQWPSRFHAVADALYDSTADVLELAERMGAVGRLAQHRLARIRELEARVAELEGGRYCERHHVLDHGCG